ncbi:MAG: hypothetical protein RBS31_00775 [Candidatus Syntrophosphaera sp.]|jgi:hypothetical protein|nr:hypothetical protein [Candidatus Cloacimonadota bacterium]MDX9948995.1 hypothetical protein [Candidatus Syntrophosphaera sp.]
MRKAFLLFAMLLMTILAFAQTVFFNEGMGTIDEDITVTAHMANKGFEEKSAFYSGPAVLKISNLIDAYPGASGGANIFFRLYEHYLLIEGINTSSYTDISMSLGHYKNTIDGNNELVIEVSEDGTNWTQLSYSRPTGAGTNNWILITPTGIIPSTENLRIRFTQQTRVVQFKIDDIKLTGTPLAEPPVPVVLSSFTATVLSQASVRLDWTTQSETGVLGFYVLRSQDNLASAELVSPLIHATNSSQTQNYSHTDTNLTQDGIYHYWLQIVDLDGSQAWHGPVSVLLAGESESQTPPRALENRHQLGFPESLQSRRLL